MKKIWISLGILAVTALIVSFFFMQKSQSEIPLIPPPLEEIPQQPISETPEKPEVPEKTNTEYHTITLTEKPTEKSLSLLVAPFPVQTILKINRIDLSSLKAGSVLVIPNTDDAVDEIDFSPFSRSITSLSSIPKILLVSQEIQAFAAYEYGSLVRWGPVSSGKKSTPTPSKLYFMNWKAKRAISTIEDSWVLPWNFNLDNFAGISIHQYQLPGYPASHSCVRLLEADAMWMYDWGEQWILTDDEQSTKAKGTPVLLFDEYNFAQKGPWTQLAENSHITDVSVEYIETKLAPNIEEIRKETEIRKTVIETEQE